MSTRTLIRRRWLRLIALVAAIVVVAAITYGLLLIPAAQPPKFTGPDKQAFAWRQDAFWAELETQFLRAKATDRKELLVAINDSFAGMLRYFDILVSTPLAPGAPEFATLETNLFQLAPLVAACPDRLTDYLNTYARLRRHVKRQSEHWPMDEPGVRERLYRTLYGGRAAVEEAMLQAPPGKFPTLIEDEPEPSATPSAVVRGITLHSGDILLSRGSAATSALIARGNDFPGNFSHVALVHVDESTRAVSVVESHIECGVKVSPIDTYLADAKLRILVLRLRADLPALVADPQLPHKAASNALLEARVRHIPYDFAMDYRDPSRQFCSEVASAAYKPLGVTLWMGLSHLSTPGVIAWLSALGVRHFETQEPSDLEYDPQLSVVAEWRDPETLFKDHLDNAVIDAMLEGAERGQPLDYERKRLPSARLAKAGSVVKNWFGSVGRIPEGMSAATALRVEKLQAEHAAITARVLGKVEKFKADRGYLPPYWELVRMAREP